MSFFEKNKNLFLIFESQSFINEETQIQLGRCIDIDLLR